MTNDEPVISLENVSVEFERNSGTLGLFGQSQPVTAVDRISLDIPENDVVALVGESGCGKTTLGKTAIGLQQPTRGAVRYRGQDIWETKAGTQDGDIPYSEIRKSLQIIHQDPGSSLNPHRTVLASLAEPLKHWEPDLHYSDREARIFRFLERVGISPPEDYAHRYPHQLSGGEKQRIALVRALLMNPDLILADEAISALDVSLRVEMMDLMLELQDQFDTSFLFISHDLSNARYLAEEADGRIGIMYLGQIVEIGPTEQVLHDPQHPYTKVLRWATPDLDIDAELSKPPVRKLDIPDPVDPPSGCRFHTRCPEAREACTRLSPELSDAGQQSRAACFRGVDDHEYWDSDPLDADSVASSADASPDA